MSCPICGPSESAAIAAGMRAGVGVLVLVTAVIVSLIARFAWRLWWLESLDSQPLAQDRKQS